jgi:hypothetical protein
MRPCRCKRLVTATYTYHKLSTFFANHAMFPFEIQGRQSSFAFLVMTRLFEGFVPLTTLDFEGKHGMVRKKVLSLSHYED